jgi:hypothetical protein
LVAARQVSEGPLAWTDPVRPQGAFPEERPGDFGQLLDQDARGEIVQVVLPAVAQRASARSERHLKELKKPLPDASHRAQMAASEPFLERTVGDSEAQAVARLAPQKAVLPAGRQPELSWRLAHLAVALAQPEPVQGARCWPRVFLLERPAQLQ